jgi:hypothetical protein
MGNIWTKRIAALTLLSFAIVIAAASHRVEARQEGGRSARQIAEQVAIDPDDIGGVVTSSKGPEAGVWVIAETTELPTNFARSWSPTTADAICCHSCRKQLTKCGCADTA